MVKPIIILFVEFIMLYTIDYYQIINKYICVSSGGTWTKTLGVPN